MTFKFFSDARADLARCLAQAGASQKLQEAVAEIEELTQRYYARFIARAAFPEMMFVGEANRLLIHANAACNALDGASPRTRQRLENARLYRKEDMALPEYAQSINDVCMFAAHAMGDGDQPFKLRESEADRALCRLTFDVMNAWRKWTGSDLPKVRSSAETTSWRSIRTLQQHPIWIVYDALGIFLDAADTERLATKVGGPKRM